MDKTKKYILMSDCPEIQKNWAPKEGDYFASRTEMIMNIYGSISADIAAKMIHYSNLREAFIHCPTQSQIQDRMGITNCIKMPILINFVIWAEKKYPENIQTYSWEQLWLALYMYMGYRKTWNGTAWIKDQRYPTGFVGIISE